MWNSPVKIQFVRCHRNFSKQTTAKKKMTTEKISHVISPLLLYPHELSLPPIHKQSWSVSFSPIQLHPPPFTSSPGLLFPNPTRSPPGIPLAPCCPSFLSINSPLSLPAAPSDRAHGTTGRGGDRSSGTPATRAWPAGAATAGPAEQARGSSGGRIGEQRRPARGDASRRPAAGRSSRWRGSGCWAPK